MYGTEENKLSLNWKLSSKGNSLSNAKIIKESGNYGLIQINN